MKKMMAMMMALAMLLALCACGGSAPAESEAPADTTAPAESSAPAEAPASGAEYKVGIVNYVDDASLNQIVENIESTLDAKGAELGVTFNYKDYYSNAQADSAVLNQIATDLVADDVDVIVAIATPTAMVMQAATEDTDIPVIFSAVTDPVAAGLVDSLDAPGGSISGTSDKLDTAAVLNLMKLTNPELSKLGLLYDTAQDSSTGAIEEAKAWCADNGVEFVEKTGSTTDDVILAAQSLVAENVDAVFTPTDNTVMKSELAIYELFRDAKIPQFCGADSFALNGAFCGYGVDYANLGVETGEMVAELLAENADISAMPVRTFDNGIAAVNTEICEALGLNLDEIKELYAPHCTQVVELTTAENFE